MAVAFSGGHLGEWSALPGLRDAVPPASGGAEPPPSEGQPVAPAPGGSPSAPNAGEASAAGSAAVAPPAPGEQPAAPPAEPPSSTVSRQQVSVSLLPGPVHIDVTPQTLSIADARGSTYGWELSLGNAAVGPLMGVQPESASGVAASGTRLAKDVTAGSYGSTGGAWVWRLDQADLAHGVTVTFRAPDCRTVTHTYAPAGGELHVTVA
jgi:hypothetical protein